MTLTQTAIITKQIIVLSIIAIILAIVSFIGYKIWYAYYLANLPKQEEKPDTKFGVLPFPNFPKKDVSTSNYTYSLDTSSGNLPKIGVDPGFDKIIKVYFIPKTYASLLSSEKSQALAAKFNIKTPPEVVSETTYFFKDQDKSLNVDLDSGNFSYLRQATISATPVNLESDNQLVTAFEGVLASLGVMKEELQKGPTKIVLLKNDAGHLSPTNLRSEAVAAQISLWPPPIDKRSILTVDFNKALVNGILQGPASSLDNYFSLDYTFWPIDLTTFATYPLKEPQAAFDDLKSGKGVVAIEPAKAQVSISSVYLAYFLSNNYTPYLLPMYVFEGPQFVAYVSAISEQYQNPAR